MSKPPKNKKARLKVAKTSSSRHQQQDEETLKSNLMKYAEEMFEFDTQGNVIKRKVDSKGIEVPIEDEEVDPNSLLPKAEKKIKLEKQKKKKVNTNLDIDFKDLLKKPD